MKTSNISWTDYSGQDLNFVSGCTPVSEGCQNCYARAIYKRWGRDHSIVTAHEDKLHRLARAKFPEHSPKRGEWHRPMAFVCDTGDLFHESVPEDFIMHTLEVMESRPDVIWQVLTKRAARMRDIVRMGAPGGLLRGNIWLGVTAENQQRADERIPILLDTPAAVRFVSVEPCLSAVDLRPYLWRYGTYTETAYITHDEALDMGDAELEGIPIDGPAQEQWSPDGRLSWIIAGAESGPHRRPFDVAWAVDLYEQCKDAGVAYFYKQGSALKPGQHDELPGLGVVHEWPTERR